MKYRDNHTYNHNQTHKFYKGFIHKPDINHTGSKVKRAIQNVTRTSSVFFVVLATVILLLFEISKTDLFINSINYYDSHCHIYFLDIGQGDSTLVKTPDRKLILVDAGPDESIQYKLSEVLPFWVNNIDLIIISHTHEDHTEGLVYLLKNYSVNELYYRKTDIDTDFAKIFRDFHNKPRNVYIYDERKKIHLSNCVNDNVNRNSHIKSTSTGKTSYEYNTHSSCSKSVIYMDTKWQKVVRDRVFDGKYVVLENAYVLRENIRLSDRKNLNNYSLVTAVRVKNNTGHVNFDYNNRVCTNSLSKSNIINLLLLTGDLEATYQDFIPYSKFLILKVPHQGSKDALNTVFLDRVMPYYAVIFASINNKYGHPHVVTLEKYKEKGVQIYCTCGKGTIHVRSLGNKDVQIEYR